MKRRTVQVTNVEYSSATKSTKMEDVEDTSRVISLTTQKTQIAQPRVENNSTISTHLTKLINANLERLYSPMKDRSLRDSQHVFYSHWQR